NSGVGGNSTGLPALGGAGGNAGFLGSHGAVGQYGTGAALQGSDGSLLPISTTGTWLTNSDGQVVLLHGLNEVYKVAPFEPSASGFSADDAAFLAANGFNAVRLGVIWAGVEPKPGVFDTAYIDSIQQTVQTLANHGIYTILDFHQDEYSGAYGGEGAPAWAAQSGGLPNTSLSFPINEFVDPAETHAWDAFWSNAQAPNALGLEDNYSQMLETVASDFTGNTDVLGYEIMNEPYPGSQAVPTLLGSPFFDTQGLTPFYNQAASAIRAVDPSTTIFYEPNLISDFGVGPTKLGTVNTSNTVFSYHNYLPNYIPIPILEGIVAIEAQAYTQANDIPSFMTEFGATNSQSSLTAAIQPADQYLTSWTEWTYSGQGDITTAGDPNAESLVFNPELPPTGDNVNTANLATLAEPYPQAISGTPKSFSFTNGTFEFNYSTEKADGSGSFPAGAQTDISVPTVEFPNGYQVSITGGQVVSAPNAPVLVIASDDGASTVNVVVSPAAAGA
ncbi:MAG TPA: cellulase family glycosylhydrolase, partial [Mycobacterium sp.]|nr:cellulase family glycosylhydrolase [Mycobacterium sp.]